MQLTDGLCSSACAIFMEMMHHSAGVRTVVAGGRPDYGPMQAPSGSRGAEASVMFDLAEDVPLMRLQILLRTSLRIFRRSRCGH